jgi:hypothetical protein
MVGNSAGAQSVSASLGIIVYPSNNQSADQIAKDEGECHAWARQNTGVDPANPMAGVQVRRLRRRADRRLEAAVRGAARGDHGDLADEDKSEYAPQVVIGAARGARQRKPSSSSATAAQRRPRQSPGTHGHFTKAFGVCMEARSYTVSNPRRQG